MVNKSKKKTKSERKVEKEVLIIIGFLGVLVILFLVSSSIFQSLNKVEYEGLTFTEERFGEIPVFHHYYYFRGPTTGELIQYNLYLRNDPTLNDVLIEGEPISYNGGDIYITLDTAYLNECEDTVIAAPSLTKFLSDNQFNVRSGNMDFVEAAIYGQEHVTCENRFGENVIQIRRGEETKIVIDGQCNDIIVGDDCRILEAVEKFQVHSFLDAQ